MAQRAKNLTAAARIQSPAREPPHIMDAARKKKQNWSSHCSSAITNQTGIHEDVGSIPGLAQWVKDPLLPESRMQLGSGIAVPVA